MRRLEEKYPNELVVIGVHAGKFWAERVTANIRQAVLRLRVEHPVVNDRFFRTWRSYAVSAWPTVVLIDPEGYVVDVHPGEITSDTYQPTLDRLVGEFDRQGKLNRQPMRFEPEAAAEPPRPLSFPGKVLADGRRLFIADTGHDRIVVVDLTEDGRSGRVETVIGGGARGLADGDFQHAAFDWPQGMALLGNVLYVADTENHVVRAVDLAQGKVETVAGTGEQARGFRIAGFGRKVPLSSPWDLAIRGRGLYIAMAGTHQIWRLDLDTGEIRPYAGTGAEEIVDGPRMTAALAQPSGLAVEDELLYFADSESSAVRVVDLPPRGDVSTIVGTGLFDFGDEDGAGDEARLQHPLGIAWRDGLLFVADTYNNKIKTVDVTKKAAKTYLGSGETGLRDGDAPLFYEPGGVSVADGKLYVADTNNHAIRVVDLATRRTETVDIQGLRSVT